MKSHKMYKFFTQNHKILGNLTFTCNANGEGWYHIYANHSPIPENKKETFPQKWILCQKILFTFTLTCTLKYSIRDLSNETF